MSEEHKKINIEADVITSENLDSIVRETKFAELPELPEGFYKQYYEHGKNIMYAYPAYHFGTALALVSLTVGRSIMLKTSNTDLYSNVYVMCIGQTSTSGKSTACNLMAKKFYPVVHQDGILERMSKKLGSPQALIQELASVPNRFWYYDECGEFFGDIRNKWSEGLVGNLCTLYDGESVSYSLAKSKGKESSFIAEKPYLTCLWATTDTVIMDQVQASEATNGFLPRWLWFWSHNPNESRKNRDYNPEDIKIEESLRSQIRDLKEFFKKIGTETPARKLIEQNPMLEDIIQFRVCEVIEDWKVSYEKTERYANDDDFRIVSARLYPQTYKVAMLLTIMDPDFRAEVLASTIFPYRCQIPEKYAKLAIQISEEYLRPRSMFVLDCTKKVDEKNTQIKIKKALIKFGGRMKFGRLQRAVHINSKPLMEALESMQDSHEITMTQVPSATKSAIEIILNKDPDSLDSGE